LGNEGLVKGFNKSFGAADRSHKGIVVSIFEVAKNFGADCSVGHSCFTKQWKTFLVDGDISIGESHDLFVLFGLRLIFLLGILLGFFFVGVSGRCRFIRSFFAIGSDDHGVIKHDGIIGRVHFGQRPAVFVFILRRLALEKAIALNFGGNKAAFRLIFKRVNKMSLHFAVAEYFGPKFLDNNVGGR